MQVGTYADGRPLNYDEGSHVFDIGGTPITVEDIVGYDRAEQIVWLSDELGNWARGLVANVQTGQQVPGPAPDEAVSQAKRGRLLGFRSKRLWKMGLASAYYGLCGLVALGVFASVKPYATGARDVVLDVASYLILVLVLLAPALLLSEFGYRDKLPFFKRRRLLWSVAGLAVFTLLMMGTAAFADSLHSQPYKAAAEQERIALQKKLDAERDAELAAERAAEARKAAEAASARSAEASKAAEAEARAEAERSAEASKAAEVEARAAADRSAEASKAAEAKRLADAKRAAEQSAAAAAASAKLQKQQASVIQFEKDVYALEARATSTIQKYQAEMTRFSKGQASIYDVYSAAANAKSACESVRSAYWDLETPKGLPDDVSALLNEVTSNLSTGYGVKADAFGAVMKFLDNQKPSAMQEFKDKVAQADAFMLQGVAKLLQAKEKMGIPLTKPSG